MVEMSEFCKKLKNKKLSFYIVRSMNTNCVNRDENNDVKTTVVEGKRTQYISSQCIKRNIREEWRN